MPIPSRQIGWSTTENLLWQISKQLERISCQLCDLNNEDFDFLLLENSTPTNQELILQEDGGRIIL